jgi:hypothetical protein
MVALGVAGRLQREWAAWREYGDLEGFIGSDYVVLTIRPAGARRLTS